MPPKKRSTEKVSKALWEAYSALEADDPLSLNARNHLWRKLWALENVQAWITKLPKEPRMYRELHQAIPYDDPELLREIQSIAKLSSESLPALYILGLVNERLERSSEMPFCDMRNSKENFIPSIQIAGSSGIPLKLNYSGYVCAGVQYGKSAQLQTTNLPLPRNIRCRLGVWMQPEKSEKFVSEELLLETGIDEDHVAFTFEVDCATLPMSYGRRRIRFHRKSRSENCFFEFQTPSTLGQHILYVHVLQEFDLVKSLLIVLDVGASKRTTKYASSGP